MNEVMEVNGANMENENLVNIMERKDGREYNKEISNMGKGAKGIDGNKIGNTVKRLYGPKSGKGNGPCNKGLRVQRPNKGLDFGPNRGEPKDSASGKRLRVEVQNVGRAGGVFSNGGSGVIRNITPSMKREDGYEDKAKGSVEEVRHP